jgi:2-succinyl-6-hydroxy-2,4-cyclohexadiene-1-carboxylate synthase
VLHVEREGSGSAVVLVHGFTQTLRSWDAVARDLAVYRTVVRADLPGHGESSDVRVHGITEAAELLGAACGEATYVGYSMGGRVCLRLALDRPDLVRALALVSASPGIEDDAERAARLEDDRALANEIERDGVEAFLDRWLAQPMFAGVPAGAKRDRLRNSAAGLAHALRALGQGATPPMWSALGDVAMPVALVVGERDAKYRAIAGRMRAMLRAHPRLAVVPGAGHAAHVEAPEMTAGFIERFLVRHVSVTS